MIASVEEQKQVTARAKAAIPAEYYSSGGFDPVESAGLFVGIRHFDDQRFSEIPYAVDDAIDLAHLFALELELVTPARVTLCLAGEPCKRETGNRRDALRKAGAHFHSARQDQIYQYVYETGEKAGKAGLFLLTLATHGLSDQGADVLIAEHSRWRRPSRTGVNMAEILDDVARARTLRRIVLIDACRERLSAGTRSTQPQAAMSETFVRALADTSGQAVLFGATLGGFAYDDPERKNGVFTAAILDGLRGAALPNERYFVTVHTLADFVNRQILDWVQRNRPDHATCSQGIGQQIESFGADMPLAIHPAGLRIAQEYQRRCGAAPARLRENIGEHITEGLVDAIVGCLTPNPPAFDWAKLLDKIEALDGSERLQLSFVLSMQEHPEVEWKADLTAAPSITPKNSASSSGTAASRTDTPEPAEEPQFFRNVSESLAEELRQHLEDLKSFPEEDLYIAVLPYLMPPEGPVLYSMLHVFISCSDTSSDTFISQLFPVRELIGDQAAIKSLASVLSEAAQEHFNKLQEEALDEWAEEVRGI